MTIRAIANDPNNPSLFGRYDRFDTSDRAATGATFLGEPYNWSGVSEAFVTSSGSNNGQSGSWGTLISSSYFVSASHYNPGNFDGTSGVTTNLSFYYTNDASGSNVQYTNNPADPLHYTTIGQIGNGDLWLGKLSTPVPANVAKYPIAAMQANNSYYSTSPVIYTVGTTIGAWGTGVRLGRNQIDSVHPNFLYLGSTWTGYNFRWDYNNPGLGNDESMVVGGDSGAPNFVTLWQNSTLALVGTNWVQITNGSTAIGSGSSFIPAYVATGQPTHFALDTLEDAMYGSGEQPSLVFDTPLKGDFNLDGLVTVADVQTMMTALSDLAGYEQLHGVSASYVTKMGDYNGDGFLTNTDVQGLIGQLASAGGGQGGSVSAVPEPASLVLLALGIWPAWRLARRKSRLCRANLAQ